MSKTLIKRILVVEDDYECATIAQQFLQQLSYSCVIAADASDALERISQQDFDLVISDIKMKGKDGLELMREARTNWPHLDFIIMTGYSDYLYCDTIAAGATDFITKPFTMGELKAKIERIAREKKIYGQLRESHEELNKAYGRIQRTLEQTINALASALEMRDPYTATHQLRVASIACAIAQELGLPRMTIDEIRLAGLIHDIGKICIPSEILVKPTRLTNTEMDLIKLHPRAGFDIVKDIEFPWPIAQIIIQHHERMDGSGYPEGLSRSGILPESRILAVADVVEAMSSHRPYRAALGIEKALHEIRQNRGVLYDPEVVDSCIRLFVEKGYKVPPEDDNVTW